MSVLSTRKIFNGVTETQSPHYFNTRPPIIIRRIFINVKKNTFNMAQGQKLRNGQGSSSIVFNP